MARERVRAILSHRSWTYAALICAAVGMLGLVYLDLIVALGVDCRIYQGTASTLVQWIGAAALVLAIPLLVLNVVRAFLVRSRRLGFLSFAVAGVGVWLFWFTIDHTFAYCMFDGVNLPPCLFGCAH